MKLKQLLICGAFVMSCFTYSCTTLTTVADHAMGYGPPDNISDGVMIGAAILADGIIYLYDNSDNFIQAYKLKEDAPEPVDRSDYVCYPTDE